MVLIMIFISKELSERFVKPIKQMADGVREIASSSSTLYDACENCVKEYGLKVEKCL